MPDTSDVPRVWTPTEIRDIVEELKFIGEMLMHINVDLKNLIEEVQDFNQNVFIGLSKGGQ